MPVSELHREVAAIALRAAAPHGFALGGGNALIAHGIIERPTQDVDVFSDVGGRGGCGRRGGGRAAQSLHSGRLMHPSRSTDTTNSRAMNQLASRPDGRIALGHPALRAVQSRVERQSETPRFPGKRPRSVASAQARTSELEVLAPSSQDHVKHGADQSLNSCCQQASSKGTPRVVILDWWLGLHGSYTSSQTRLRNYVLSGSAKRVNCDFLFART